MFSTVDADSVRTELALGADESAVIEKIPLTLKNESPVNALVERYDSRGIVVTLNGAGATTLTLRDGALPVKPGVQYEISTSTSAVATQTGEVQFDLTLNGPTRIEIRPVEK
jgi:hypothetical protein